MKRFLYKTVFLTLCVSFNPFLIGSWIERKAEGWAWYEDKNKEEKVEEKVISSQLTATEKVQEIRKNLEEKLAQAILYPTEENVTCYMREQKKWIDQSGEFAKAWSKALLSNPNLDESVTGFPVSQYGIQVQKQILQEEKEQLLRGLAKENGLFFFYEGKSKASQVFGQVVKEFSKKYGWEVFAISVDGFYLEGFNETKEDKGISRVVGVRVFPSLFVVNPKSKEVVPVSYGLSSLDQIENNVAKQFLDNGKSNE